MFLGSPSDDVENGSEARGDGGAAGADGGRKRTRGDGAASGSGAADDGGVPAISSMLASPTRKAAVDGVLKLSPVLRDSSYWRQQPESIGVTDLFPEDALGADDAGGQSEA